MFKVSKRTLLLIAGIVWLAAGGNIAWLGIQAFAQINMSYVWAIILSAVVVFTLFHMKIFSKPVWASRSRFRASASSCASHVAAAPPQRAPLASLRSRARRNRARLRAKPTRQASRIPPHIASKARSHPKQRPLQDADWMGTDDIIACPDPNCGARFKITRVGTRTFRPRTRRPSRRSSTDTRAFKATATHSSARAHDTRASST